MKVIKTNNTLHLYRDDVETYDRIPVGTYTICFAKNVGFYLMTRNDMVVEEKVYGCHPEKARKVLASFKDFNRSLGVIMSGAKGIGKSVSAKLIAAEALSDGLPVIVCDQYVPGIASFIESIDQEVMILFDEFDKVFAKTSDENPQASMLSLFDGTAVGKKLYVVTCNYLNGLNDYLVNRPGRFHYHFRFDYPDADGIREYLRDKVTEEGQRQIEDVVSFSKKVDLNYDCLRSIAFEINHGATFAEAVKDLNIVNLDEERYTLVLRMTNGVTFQASSVCIDLFDKGARVHTWTNRCGSGCGCYVSFCVGDVQLDMTNGKLSVAKDLISVDNPYDDDDGEREDYQRWKKEMHPESLMVYRNRGKSLHYLL